VDVLLTSDEAAELADISPAQLKLWLSTEKFKTSTTAEATAMAGHETHYYFDETDVQRLIEFAATQHKRKPTKQDRFVDDGTLTDFTVAQVASMWQLSSDTIQRLFQDEPGVTVLGDKNPRGKRRRTTLRIPRAVMERVKRRRSNV